MAGERKQNKLRSIIIGEDRISNMPDTILHHILSFLNIKHVVQTCALSRRWRYVCTSIPNLDFKYHKYPFTGSDHYDDKMPSFTNFVNHVLSRRDSSNVNKFCFSSGYLVDPNLVKKCICYAVRHNVQELNISAFFPPKPIKFPRCFGTCESLRVLKLTAIGNHMVLPKSLVLPSLKTLHLERFPSTHSFNVDILSCCPNLETLILRNCYELNISAPQLRNLEILYRKPMMIYEKKVVLSTPILTSFKYEGHNSLVCSMGNLPCLDKVYIDFHPDFISPQLRGDNEQKYPLNLIKMLGQLRNATFVTLSLKTIKVLASVPGLLEHHPSPFCNLKHLKLKAERKCSTMTLPLNVISYLIRGSSCGDTMVVEFSKA